MDYRPTLSFNKTFVVTTLLTLLSLFLAGCSQPSAPSATPLGTSTVESVPSVPPTATFTPAATLTPRPAAVLVAPAGADPGRAAELEALLAELSSGAGYDFHTTAALTQAEITSGLRVAVVLQPFPGLAELAAAAPRTQFIGVGIPDLEPNNNLVVVDPQAAPPAEQGFLSGYLAAVVTSDWRTGVISAGSSAVDQSARQGFMNGVVYFCGLCRPAYPPFVQYPVSIELSPGADLAVQGAAVDALIAQGVTTVFIAPGADSQELRTGLAQTGINIISTTPPGELDRDSWIATIQADWLAGVRQAWEAAAAGQPYDPASPLLKITDVNEAILTEGRLRVVEQVRDDLAAGLIDTGVDLNTGISQ